MELARKLHRQAGRPRTRATPPTKPDGFEAEKCRCNLSPGATPGAARTCWVKALLAEAVLLVLGACQVPAGRRLPLASQAQRRRPTAAAAQVAAALLVAAEACQQWALVQGTRNRVQLSAPDGRGCNVSVRTTGVWRDKARGL